MHGLLEVYGVKNAINLENVKNFTLENVKISLVDNPAELVTYNTNEINIADVKLFAEGSEYNLAEGEKLTMPDNFDKTKEAVVMGVITTKDAAFAEGKGTVKLYLDRGTLQEGNKAPVITPYDAEIKAEGEGKYSFRAAIPLTDKPDYQYAYRPETEAENMNRGNHILSIVASGMPYDQNTWNYNVKCKADE